MSAFDICPYFSAIYLFLSISHVNNTIWYNLWFLRWLTKTHMFLSVLAMQYLTPCLLCTILVLFSGFLCFFPARKRKPLRRRNRSRRLLNRSRRYPAPCCKKLVTTNEDGAQTWGIHWHRNLVIRPVFLLKDIFLIIQIPSPKRGIYGFAWMLCTQIGSLTIKLGYDAPFLDKPTTPFLLGIYIFSSHTIILVGKFPNY